METLSHLPCIRGNQKIIILNPENKRWVKMPIKIYDFYLNKVNGEKKLCDFLNRKYRLFEVENIEKTTLKSVYFTLTGRCNLRCSFCIMGSSPSISIKNDLSLEEIRNIVLPKLKELDPQKIVLTGGEPFVRSDLKEIICMLRRYFDKKIITLQTNGLLIKKTDVDFLDNNIGAIEFSIENLFENQKNLNKMKSIFKLLKNKNIIISFSFVAHNATKRYLENALELCNEFDAYFILRPLSMIGRAKEEHKSDIMKEEREVILLYIKMLKYIIRKGYYTNNICAFIFPQPILRKNCGAFGSVVALQPDGTIYMCENLRSHRYELGNIRTDSVYKIKNTINIKMNDRDYRHEFLVKPLICRACKVTFFCSGPCIAERPEHGVNFCYIKKWLIEFNLFYIDSKKTMEENLKQLLLFLKNKYDKVYT